jgi:beta-mannosidase
MKDVPLAKAELKTSIDSIPSGYRLRVDSQQLARDVYVSFGNLDTKLSDNYFDLLPGESVELELKSSASLDQLRQAVKAISLSDAFLPSIKRAPQVSAGQ